MTLVSPSTIYQISTDVLCKYLPTSINPIQGGCKFAHPYLDVTKRKIWSAAGAPNFVTFNIIISDILCENFGVCSTSTIFYSLFSKRKSSKMSKLVNFL